MSETYRAFADRIVRCDDLETKLAPPGDLVDVERGPPTRPTEPGRPANLRIVPSSEAKVPRVAGMAQRVQRGRILHAFANHELQAVELFAWALLAYPDAPDAFRTGLLAILAEEQRHVRLYLARLKAHDVALGDYPVSGYFWGKVPHLTTPARFVCAMSLTFENANLDHTAQYAEAARRAGDEATAAVIDRIGRDEIGHVKFGATWLAQFDDRPLWEAYQANVTWPLSAERARGANFQPDRRREAGLDEAFIAGLAALGGDPDAC
jgi:uncharacterized ferritin-like protein (DUF455 family)